MGVVAVVTTAMNTNIAESDGERAPRSTFSTTGSIRRSLFLFLLRPVGRRGENQPRYFFSLIHPHKVASSIQEGEIRGRKTDETFCATNLLRYGSLAPKNESNGRFEFFELGRCYGASPYS
jgi:hypothetical protein